MAQERIRSSGSPGTGDNGWEISYVAPRLADSARHTSLMYLGRQGWMAQQLLLLSDFSAYSILI